MCMLIFLLHIPHTYSTRSMQSTNILYANCNLPPILSTCCARIPLFLPITSKIIRKYISLFDQTRKTIYSFLSTEVNIQSPFFHSQESQKLFSGCNEFLQVKIDFPFKDFLQGDLKTCINTLTRAEH